MGKGCISCGYLRYPCAIYPIILIAKFYFEELPESDAKQGDATMNNTAMKLNSKLVTASHLSDYRLFTSKQRLVRDDVSFPPVINSDDAVLRASERLKDGQNVFGLVDPRNF